MWEDECDVDRMVRMDEMERFGLGKRVMRRRVVMGKICCLEVREGIKCFR